MEGSDSPVLRLESENYEIVLTLEQAEKICETAQSLGKFSLSTLGNRAKLPRHRLVSIARFLESIGCISTAPKKTRIFVKECCPSDCPIRAKILEIRNNGGPR